MQRSKDAIPDFNLEINKIAMEKVQSFKFLGITIDSNVSWKDHIEKVRTKISRSIGVIRHLQRTVPSPTLKVLYNSLILPHLQYGILLWGKQASELALFQKRAVCVVVKAKYLTHTDPIFKELNLLKN